MLLSLGQVKVLDWEQAEGMRSRILRMQGLEEGGWRGMRQRV